MVIDLVLNNKNILFYGLLLALILISSCAPPSQVAVFERPIVSSQVEVERLGGQRIHIIKAGDTLYSIAFSNRLNVNTLAAWNNVTDTSRLAIGQRIRLTKPSGFLTDKKVVVIKNNDRKLYIQNRITYPQKAPIWSWPTKGKVTKLFAPSQGQQGVNIEGRLGQEILTTSKGEVVYVGNGLKGYGNLIIIKHSDQYLSAYAHNQKTFVREGQHIKAQTKIATMGKSKNKETTLHFQIRKNGKPVDPMKYLPG